jgi:hypothetical protein
VIGYVPRRLMRLGALVDRLQAMDVGMQAAAGWIGAMWGPATVKIMVAILVLFSHHGNVLQDWSSSIWSSTCSGTAVGDPAQDI